MMFSTRSTRLALLSAGLLAATAGAANAGFSYSGFSSTSGLTLVSAAVQTGNTVSVTPPAGSVAGAMYKTGKVPVAGGFDTTFNFSIADINGPGSDGFAFVIQNSSQTAIGAHAGAMGYATNLTNPSMVGIANCLAIEFDTWNNQGDWADFNSDMHISVQSMGTAPNSPAQSASLGASLGGANWANGQVHAVRVLYTPGTLSVFLDNLTTPLLSVSVNLATLLSLDAGSAYVGFTAGTGGIVAAERHQIHSWNYAETATAPAPSAALALGLGGLAAGRRRRA